MSITETLTEISRRVEAEADNLFIVAAQINVYNEAIRRREGRIIYGPGDVRALFDILHILINEKDHGKSTISRSREPTEEEEASIIDPPTVDDVYKEIADAAEVKPSRRV